MKRLTCAQVEPLREAYLLDTLSARQRRTVAAHLDSCATCREALDPLRARLALLDAAGPVEAPPGLAGRTLAHIAAEERAHASRGLRARIRLAYLCAALLLGFALFLLVPAFQQPRSGISHNIRNSLAGFHVVFKMYAHESPGEKYPPVAGYDGVWVPDLRALGPEFIGNDIAMLVDPDAPPHSREALAAALRQEPPDYEQAMRILANTYVYHGWAPGDDASAEALQRFQIARGVRDNDIVTDTTRLYRLREGVERFLITDINNPAATAMSQSSLPIMIARPRPNHPDDGALIRAWRRFREQILRQSPTLFVPTLYMDGHIEFIPLEDAPANVKAMLDLFPGEMSFSP